MKKALQWLQGYTPTTHTLVGLLTLLQAAYMADADLQQIVNRMIGTHPVTHIVTGYCLLVLALYRNGAASKTKQEMEKPNGK